ncbi:zinc finger MYM-type protein 1-like [Salvia splendens]|uniref:zinc finger MYM-type protein 1-like n=1 Tax=Salvia splendens TaxID=180675 RepID=UPI001C28008E|nr:zinc finger MYM-type protein 1-like [Salvia splendens]
MECSIPPQSHVKFAICYILRTCKTTRLHGNGQDAFVSGGFTVWRKKERLRDHVGNHKSAHNRCRLACEDLMNQAQDIEVSLAKQSTQSKLDYRLRLDATIISLRYLIMQGLPFGGHDESEESLNQGNFLEFLKVISSCNEEIASVVLKNAPDNLKLTSPDIQRDIINAFAVETTKAIVHDMRSEFFSILVDECRDVSVKEQMGVVVRYVDKNGCVIERFLGVVHVSDTTATSLEKALDYLLSTYDLSISSLRGQGYDGASNMRGEFNGLKSLILKRNSSAYYVHCFAHQLQLTIVAVAKKHKIYVGENGHDDSIRAEADDVLEIINSFEFVFVLHLMKQILGITHELSQVLQKKDQDIVNAMNLVKVAKSRLQIMREKDWDVLLADVSKFCSKYELDVLDMEDEFVVRKKGRRRAEKMKNLHYY